jgi:hypothetical protein
MGIAISAPKSLLLATASKQKTKRVILASWKSVGMAMFTHGIGNAVYGETFDAIESSGRMAPLGRGSLQGEMRRDVNQQQ